MAPWLRKPPRHLEVSPFQGCTCPTFSPGFPPQFHLQKRGILGICAVVNFHLGGHKSLNLNLDLVKNCPKVFHEVHVFVVLKVPNYGKTLAIHPLVDSHFPNEIPMKSPYVLGVSKWPAPRYRHWIRQHAPGESSWFQVQCVYVPLYLDALWCIYLDYLDVFV